MSRFKIALDCDGVICNFTGGTIKRAKELGLEFVNSIDEVNCWDIHPNFSKVMKEAWGDADFWLNLNPLNTISFTPHCYITSRPIETKVTEQWLDKHGFPKAKVITVAKPEDKIQHLLDEGVDLLIDDLHSTVRAALDAGIKAFLFVQPYQRGHEQECKDLPKLHSLEDLKILC